MTWFNVQYQAQASVTVLVEADSPDEAAQQVQLGLGTVVDKVLEEIPIENAEMVIEEEPMQDIGEQDSWDEFALTDL